MKTYLVAAASLGAILLASAAPALAQPTSTTVVTEKSNGGTGVGIVGGAVAGAAVGGPVGAVVGGAIGAVAGHTVDPPVEVKTYIRTQHVDPVTYDGPIVVGSVLPETVTEYDIPKYERYRWTYIHGQRLLVDRRDHKIVAVLNDNE
ncbi:MAG: DUF1236 domain-containing protein [Phenylobacterium sp.]|nr:MAG: DUF1236 domain-containing protein [Phenylobacterium sp.]